MSKNKTGKIKPSDTPGNNEPVTRSGTKKPSHLAGTLQPDPVPFGAIITVHPVYGKILSVDPGEGKGDMIFDGVNWFENHGGFKGCIDYAVSVGVTRIYTERSFSSFNTLSRKDLIEYAEDKGVKILTINTRETAKKRRSLGWEKKKSKNDDRNDAKIIHMMACEDRLHFKVASAECDEWKDFSSKARHIRMLNRKTMGEPEEVRDFLQDLIGERALKEHGDTLLISTGKLSVPIACSVAIATVNTKCRQRFEKLTGLYVNGHPSIFRSDLHHWGYRPRKENLMRMSPFRRSVRWLRSQIKLHEGEILKRFPHLKVA